MAFAAEEFIQGITWEAFDELKKPDLMTLAAYLEIDVKHAMRKQVIKNMLIDRLVTDDLLGQECLENKIEILDSSDSAIKLKQLEIQKELEMAKLQIEQEQLQHKLQIEEQERKEKLDLERSLKQQELDAKLQFEAERKRR